jgi:subtilisin family serine protease
MATPQVTGVCALYLQRNPTKTPAQVKAWLIAKSKSNQVKTSVKTDDWNNAQALLGGPNRYLFNPYRGGYTD